MERVYKRESILFKILPCLLIAMYAVMCLYGSTVCASNSKIYNSEVLNYDFTLNVNDTFDANNIKFLLLNYTYLDPDNNKIYVFFEPIFYTGIAYFDNNNQKIHIKNGLCWYFSNSSTYDKNNLESIGDIFQNDLNEKVSNFDFSCLADEKNFVDDRELSCYQKGFTTEEFYVTSSNNVYDYSNPDDVVFQGASQEALATLIKPQVEGIQLQEILQEIIQILPVILVVIVALIAIRKAIRLLLRVLRNS